MLHSGMHNDDWMVGSAMVGKCQCSYLLQQLGMRSPDFLGLGIDGFVKHFLSMPPCRSNASCVYATIGYVHAAASVPPPQTDITCLSICLCTCLYTCLCTCLCTCLGASPGTHAGACPCTVCAPLYTNFCLSACLHTATARRL